ncbi:HU family DNA-binding protein [uncultured Porphyromonas sp.]|uniref:HU family DNA-binding protein n=1 Tax=uncultured Porphyromonas sp. TaxID=159274 RepID=UPI002631BF16|nr:HU family DNA-binding protein [uncultured Porphyromonas sp.]
MLSPYRSAHCTTHITKLMNKTEFIARVAEKADLTKVDARAAVEAFATVVADELKKGGKVALLGFGTFSVTDKPAREGINPQTKKKIQIPARKSVKFKAGAALNLNAPAKKGKK